MFWVRQDQKQKLLWVHHIICRQRSFNLSHIVSNLIFGRLVFYYMRCVLWCHPSMLKVFISWLKKSYRENILMCQAISVRTSQCFCQQCCRRIQIKDQISMEFSNFQLSKKGSSCFWMKMISKKNFHILSFMAKMCLTNLEPNKQKQKQRPQETKQQQKNWRSKKNFRKKWWNYKFKIQTTSPRQVRIQNNSMKCTWIILRDWIKGTIPVNQTTAVWFQKGHIRNRAQQ